MNDRAAIFTLGCRTNQYDEQMIVQSLIDGGFRMVPFSESADLYVVNTCTVTHRSDADSRKAIRMALRHNPDAFIVVVGCYSHRAKEEISAIPGVDLIIGNPQKTQIIALIPNPLEKYPEPTIITSTEPGDDSFGQSIATSINRSRALMKIQDGCDQFCAYCIVPSVRGAPRSLEKNEILHRIGELAAMGYAEIVLTGIHLGIWGREFDENLSSLINGIDNLDGAFRIRFSSIEPMEVESGLIDSLINSHRVCRHLHVPIQSASDSLLKQMGRPYSIFDVARLLDKIKSHDSGWNIGTDLMIGFPTQTDKFFQEELRNLEILPIDYFHLFTYSKRTGTAAYDIKPEATDNEIKYRLKRLKEIDSDSRNKFLKSQDNQILQFTIEKYPKKKQDNITGMSDNYLRAKIEGDVGNRIFINGRLKINNENEIVAEQI
ncbi:MAG: tRNA (N(6)-L-threonylcarbamoyladenosine(37)-C(2))-methylthiotransferase MtaB [bacterium]